MKRRRSMGSPVVAEEGQHRVQEARGLGAAEHDVHDAGLEAGGALLPDEQLRHQEDGPVRLARHGHQGGEGVGLDVLARGVHQRRLLQEDEPAAAPLLGLGEALGEASVLEGTVEGAGEPGPQVDDGPEGRQVPPHHGPGQVEEVDPRGGAHDVDHEAPGMEGPQLVLGLGGEAHPVEVAGPHHPGDRTELFLQQGSSPGSCLWQRSLHGLLARPQVFPLCHALARILAEARGFPASFLLVPRAGGRQEAGGPRRLGRTTAATVSSRRGSWRGFSKKPSMRSSPRPEVSEATSLAPEMM
jgi:hypothetical protein